MGMATWRPDRIITYSFITLIGLFIFIKLNNNLKFNAN